MSRVDRRYETHQLTEIIEPMPTDYVATPEFHAHIVERVAEETLREDSYFDMVELTDQTCHPDMLMLIDSRNTGTKSRARVNKALNK